MLCEEELECVHLLRDTLDIIQTIDTNDDFYTIESLFQVFNPIDHTIFLQILCSCKELPECINTSKPDTDEVLLTSKNDVGSIPIGNVPTCASRPSNSTPLGIVGRPRIRVHEERKWRA